MKKPARGLLNDCLSIPPIEQWWERTSHLITEQSGWILGGWHIVVCLLGGGHLIHQHCLQQRFSTIKLGGHLIHQLTGGSYTLLRNHCPPHSLSNPCPDWEIHPFSLSNHCPDCPTHFALSSTKIFNNLTLFILIWIFAICIILYFYEILQSAQQKMSPCTHQARAHAVLKLLP